MLSEKSQLCLRRRARQKKVCNYVRDGGVRTVRRCTTALTFTLYCRISTQKSIKAFSNRVRQLQDFITANGLAVPPPEDHQNSWTLDRLMDTYGHPQSPSNVHSSRSDAPISLTSARTLGGAEGGGSQEAEFSREEYPALEQESGFETDQLQTFPVSANRSGDPADGSNWPPAPMPDFSFVTDADWVWSMPLTNESHNSGYLDTSSSAPLMDFFAGASGPPLFDVQTEPMDLQLKNCSVAENSEAHEYEDHAEVTSQISDRMGGLLISKDGQWRFYGATSNLHLAKGRPDFGSTAKGISQQMSQNAERLQLFGIAQAVDSTTVQELLDLYFSWYNASLHIVDRGVFQHARHLYMRESRSSTFYSDFLVNAM